MAAVLAVSLCLTLVLPQTSTCDMSAGYKSPVTVTNVKTPTGAANAGKFAHSADLPPVAVAITEPAPLFHELALPSFRSGPSVLSTGSSGRAPPPTA